MENMELINEGLFVSIYCIFLETGRVVDILDEYISSLNHEENVFLRKYLEGCADNVRDVYGLCHCSVPT